VHVITGYNPDPGAIQTQLAIWGIRIHMALIPFILTFIGFFIMFKWFDLKGEKKERIFEQLKEKGLK
jgi:Na+/melibiose symporter-like transporter